MYQMPYAQQHPFPIYGTAPPQMKLDTHGSPSPVETNHHGHPIPAGCHGCCNYGYAPAYFSHPYFHPPQPQPFYYPPFSPMYHPIPYSPQPCYPVNQPRYEFDKNNHHLTDHHCCGCRDSQYNTKQDPHVNTQQIKPNIQELHNSSFVPIEPISNLYSNELKLKKNDQNPCLSRVEDKMKNSGKRNKDEIDGERNQFPFPIFWLPYKNALENQGEYDEDPRVKNQQTKPNIQDLDSNSLDSIEPKSQLCSAEPAVKKSDQNPCLLGLQDMVNATGKSNQDQIEGVRNQFPFPMFWLPYSENQKEYDKGGSLSTKGENNMIEKPKEVEGRDGIDESVLEEKRKKNSSPKLIPVKQVVENREEREKQIAKERGNNETKPRENVAKTKLPPVCLRVEPLTKKKNGKPRSPSPKRNENKASGSTQIDKNEVKSDEKVVKSVKVVDGKTVVEDERVEPSKDIKEKEEKEKVPRAKPEEANILEKTVKEDINLPEKKEIEKRECETAKARKRLSEHEAAVVIQSAYRGLEVRRWDPVKKLKQIDEIRVMVDEVRGRIEALKASSDSSSSVDKQRLVIGETIMSLLLKLDTVQGLHPIVRERRKSVAKELMSLTDQLDSLGIKSSESRTLELKGGPMEGHAKAEVSEESKDGSVAAVSLTCELNEEEMKEQQQITQSETEHQEEDLHKHETMVTKTVVSEPVIDDEGCVSERKVPFSAVDASTEQPSDGELSLKEDEENELVLAEVCKEPQGGDMEPAEVANDNATVAVMDNESKDNLKDEIRAEDDQESKEYSLPEDLKKDEIKREMGTDSGGSNCLDAFMKKSSIEGEYAAGDQQAKNTEAVLGAKPDEPEELLAEGLKPEEFHGEEKAAALEPEDMKRCETEPEMEPQSKYVLESADPEDGKNVEPPEDVKLCREKQNEIGRDASEMEPKESQEKHDEIGSDKKLEEENEKLREMVAKLVESGKEQLSVISSLSGRVKDLEMKLGKKKKPKTGRVRVRSSRVKASDHNTTVKGVAVNGKK